MKEPEFCTSSYKLIVEDMEVMTDAELQAFSLKYKVCHLSYSHLLRLTISRALVNEAFGEGVGLLRGCWKGFNATVFVGQIRRGGPQSSRFFTGVPSSFVC